MRWRCQQKKYLVFLIVPVESLLFVILIFRHHVTSFVLGKICHLNCIFVIGTQRIVMYKRTIDAIQFCKIPIFFILAVIFAMDVVIFAQKLVKSLYILNFPRRITILIFPIIYKITKNTTLLFNIH